MKLQFSLARLFGSTTLLAIGAALIGILCRPGYDLRSTIMPFIIATAAGSCIGVAIALLFRWPILAWIGMTIFGAMVGAYILLSALLDDQHYL